MINITVHNSIIMNYSFVIFMTTSFRVLEENLT
jgi:hypothetical protein